MVKNTTEEPVATDQEELATVDGAPAAEVMSHPAEALTAAPEGAEADPEPVSAVKQLVDMTPEERFRATTKLIFLAPDVPPIPPRPRRSEIFRSDAQRAEGHRIDTQDSRRSEHRRGDSFRGDSYRGDSYRSESRRNESRRDSHAQDFRQLDELLDDHAPHDHDSHDTDADRQSSRRTRRRDIDEDASRRDRRQAPVVTEPQKVRGSTRLEAKKQRRRDGRDAGRRRSVITESEFLARRNPSIVK